MNGNSDNKGSVGAAGDGKGFYSRLSRRRKIIIISVLLVAHLGGAAAGYRAYRQSLVKPAAVEAAKKEVKVAALGSFGNGERLTTEGTVKAAAKVSVVALSGGKVKAIPAKVGDTVAVNQPLVYLGDDVALTNLVNATNNLNNLEQSLANTRNLSQENVRQAELGVRRAEEAVAAAEIGLKAAQDNLNNIKVLQEKAAKDTKNNAVINYSNYLNSISFALTQCNFIIKAEGSNQLEGIAPTLAVKDSTSLETAKTDYVIAKQKSDQLAKVTPTPDTVADAIEGAITGLNLAKTVVDDTIIVLDNTISSITLSESALNGQRANFAALRASTIGTLNASQSFLQTLENLDLLNKQQLDGLASALAAAQNQLNQARVGSDNALAALASARSGSSQQQILAQTSLDNARGQYNLAALAAANLTVKAPITGRVTAKSVEVGTEVRAGQPVAEVSQTNLVKIELELAPDDALRVRLGDRATINGKYEGLVNQIDPAADPLSKKMTVEIIYPNAGKELVPETLASVSLPVAGGISETATFVVPLFAVTVSQNENYVFIIENSRAKKVPVSVEQVEGEKAIIKTDLAKDTQLVIEGNKLLEDGEEVTVIK